MSDNNSVAGEAIQNPADVKQTEEPGKVEADEQTGTHGAAGVAEAEIEKQVGEKAAESTQQANGKGDRRDGGRNDGGKRRYNDRNDRNERPDPEAFHRLPQTDDPVEIRDQVEFYFSNHNLTTDEHMFSEMEGPLNRPIFLKHLSTFKRMRRFQPYSAIVNALRESESLELVEDGNYSGTGNEGVRRKDAIVIPGYDTDKYTLEGAFSRFKRQSGNKLEASIYAKGFGDEDKAGQIAIEKFFKPYGAVVVRKRREADSNKWKGSVFVEFDSHDSQQQFLALDPKPKFNGNELTIMGKKEYNEMKCKEKGIEPGSYNDAGRNKHSRDSRGRGRGGRGSRGSGRGGRGGRHNDRHERSDRRDNRRRRDRSSSRDSIDSRDWHSRRDKFQKSRDYKNDRRESRNHSDKKESFELPKDENGVPVVRDTRGESESKSNKRKADDAHENTSKKSKIEIKEDA